MALEQRFETLTPSMGQIQPSSVHSLSNYNSVSTIGLVHLQKTTEKSTSLSLISKALRLLTLRIPSLSWTYSIHWLGETTTENLPWSSELTLDRRMWSVKPKPNS